MAVVIKYVTKIRNNWKKSVFAAVVLSYGGNWAKEKYETNDLMRNYCNLAADYGRISLPPTANPRRVTVILNPAANKRSAAEDFETYCAPILSLAGLCVDVVQTASEGNAREIVAQLSGGCTDALVIAGGDGTVSEVVTGLLRRVGEERGGDMPIGILPLGRTNSFANLLFPGGEHLAHVRSMADACMAVIQEITKPVDVMRIEVLETDEEYTSKPIYAISSIEWGAYRDTEMRFDKYWYFGFLRKYMTYIFSGYKTNITWNCDADLTYSPPCNGCSNCYVKPEAVSQKKWYKNMFSQNSTPKNSAANIQNEDCATINDKKFSTSDFKIISSNLISNEIDSPDTPKLQLNLGPGNLNYVDFVSEGWRSIHGGQRIVNETIEARQLEIKPVAKEHAIDVEKKPTDKPEQWFSIDKEEFEVKPVRVTILPKILNIFCKGSENLNVS